MLDKAGTFKALAQITNTHKRESVLVVTVGILDGTAWLTAMRTPNPPNARPDPAPSVAPRAWGSLQISFWKLGHSPFISVKTGHRGEP